VTAALQPDQKLIDDLASGLSKDLVFYIDLFRHWKVWPDEFVLGMKIVRVLQSDPIKREYIGSSTEGNIRTIKRFKDPDSMIPWGMNIPDLKLTNVKALEPGDYYIKVSVESILRKPAAGHRYCCFLGIYKRVQHLQGFAPFQNSRCSRGPMNIFRPLILRYSSSCLSY